MSILAIEAKNLRKQYESVEAVSGLDLAIPKGEIFGLVGPDGAGKTTTIRMLCTLSLPSGGEARILGMDILKETGNIKKSIGYMSERFSLYPTLTVKENLEFFARLRNVPRELAEPRQKELLHFCRLEPFQNRHAEHLSGGMQKKLALVCSLIHQPEVLFLDEPTTGIDPVSRRDFWSIISEFLSRGVTVLVSTPYLDEAERFNRVALMHQGKIIVCDTPQNIKGQIAGELLEIKAEPSPKAVGILRKINFTSGTLIFGDTIHVLVDHAQKRLTEIKNTLEKENITVLDLRQIEPNLEDAFVTRLSALEARSAVRRVVSTGSKIPSGKRDGVAIRVANLTRKFGDFTAVNQVSFEVNKGEIFGLLGPNGSGKTTTIRIICGLLFPTRGKTEVLGQDMAVAPHIARANLGYMSQKFSLFHDLTVEENINFYGGIYTIPGPLLKERKEWVLDMAGLRGKEKLLARELAGGWKQRLALGCTILHRPEVIFLDEPTAGVDPLSRRFFWELIQELTAGGATIFITTHYMDEAEHCHRLGLMHQGRLIALDSPSRLKTGAVRGELLEVATSDFSRAEGLLTGHPVCRHVSLFGSTLHVVVDEVATASPLIETLLTGNGITVRSIKPIPFTMEDIFISLIEEQDIALSVESGEKGA